VDFIEKVIGDAGSNGVVVGLSGGIDSAVVGALCVRALGRERVVALLMPSEFTPSEDLEDAKGLAASWGVRTHLIPITSLALQLSSSVDIEGDKIARGNAQARIRMMISYYYANSLKLLVAGTGDRSEDLEGFFTKFGDGGVDFLPIAHLYKTQVRGLGMHIGIPPRIVNKAPSPRLWPGHLASDELPVDYGTLDLILYCLHDIKMPPDITAKEVGVERNVVEAVIKMNRESTHKRAYPPMVRPW
jgi:NAD+ synthase